VNLPAQSLPHILRRIRDVGGMDAVLKLVKVFGGKRIFIPRYDVSAGHPLALAGTPVAKMLVDEFGGNHVDFPRGRAHIRLMIARDVHAEGGSTNDIAQAADISHQRAKQLRRMVRNKKQPASAGRPRKRNAHQRELI